MKVFLFSDLHASCRQLSNIQRFWDEHPKITTAVFAGDLVNMGHPIKFIEEFVGILADRQMSLLWVPGNNDFGSSYELLNKAFSSLEGRVVEFGGRCFTGVGGSPESWAAQYAGNQSVMANNIAGTIFISHYPPAPTNLLSAKHLAYSPLIHICGHIHREWGVSSLGRTQVIKLGASELGHYAILDTNSFEVSFARFN